MLKMQNISKIYRTESVETHALRDFSLSVDEGEFVSVSGPSGSGKTTFLNIAGLLEEFTSGIYELDGKDVTGLNDNQRSQLRNQKIGFIFQSFNLLKALTALQNVELVLSTRGVSGKAAQARARALLQTVGVEQRQQNTPKMLSGGEQQRVAIARALANNPDLILADEPTASLDSRRGREIMELLRMIAKELNKAVVVVSHDLRVREVADRVLWLEDGEFRDISAEAGAKITDPKPWEQE